MLEPNILPIAISLLPLAAADTLVTLLNTILTAENVAVIKDLVEGLLEGVELPEAIDGLIEEVLGDPDGIVNLIGTVLLVLTGDYSLTIKKMIFKYLGAEDYNVANADKAIESLDRLVGKAVPVVLPLIAGEDVEDGSIMDIISDAAADALDENKNTEGFLTCKCSR